MAWDKRRRYGGERPAPEDLSLCLSDRGRRGRRHQRHQRRDESSRGSPIRPRRTHRLGGFELALADALLLDTLDRMAAGAAARPTPMEASLAYALRAGLRPRPCRGLRRDPEARLLAPWRPL